MADDTIQVAVEDKVDSKVATKLRTIADNAELAFNKVEALNKSLGKVKVNAFDQAAISAEKLRKATADAGTAEERHRQQIQRTQQQLARTDSAINKLIASEEKATQAKQKSAKATAQVGESEAERTARISAMVDASLKEVEARNEANRASIASAEASDKTAKAVRSEAEAMAERVAAMQKAEKTAEDNAAIVAELNRQLAVGVKTTEDVARVEGLLDRAMAKGALSTEEQAKALANLDKQASKIKNVSNEVNNLGGVSAQTSRQISSMLVNLAQGQWAAARANVVGMAQSTGLLNGTLAGLGTAAGAASVGLAGLLGYVTLIGAAALKSRNEYDEFNNSLLTNGRISGATAGELAVLSSRIGDITHNYEEARGAVNSLARDGKVSADQMALVATSAASFAKLSGTEVKEISKELSNVFAEPIKSAVELNNKYSFLTVATYKQVAALQEQGDKQGAATRLLEEFASVSSKRLAEATNDTNGLAAAWQNVGNKIGWAWQQFKEQSAVLTGSASKMEELALLQARMAKFNEQPAWVKGLTPDALIEKNTKRIKELTDSLEGERKAAREAAAAQQVHDKAIAATDSLKARELELDKTARKTKELKDLNAELTAAYIGGNSGITMDDNGNFNDERSLKLIAAINEKYKDKGAERAAKAAAKAEETRASALAKVNAQLDNEIARMGMLGSEREAQEQFDKVSEALMGRRITLTEQEKNAIREKVDTLAKAREEQAAMDRIYEQATGPIREFNATLDAANKLVEKGSITWQQFFGVTAQAEEAYKSAIDPLYQINKGLDEQTKLLALNSQQREIETQIINAQNAAIASGQKIREEDLAQLRARLTVMQELQRVSAIEDSIRQGSGSQRKKDSQDRITAATNVAGQGGVDPTDIVGMMAQQNTGLQATQAYTQYQVESYTQMYAEIDALRQADLLSDTDAQLAKFAIFQQQSQQYLSAASTVFSSLSTLQSSENKKQAAIGKKAAIAQTLVQTYMSATSSFSAMSGIPYIGPILGVAAAAAAIAAGMANVQKIRATNAGFMEGGYTGNMPRTSIAGPVHGQEYVFDAAATQRIGVGNLEALRRGRVPTQLAGQAEGQGSGQRANFAPTINVNVEGGRMDRRTPEQIARATRMGVAKEFERSY